MAIIVSEEIIQKLRKEKWISLSVFIILDIVQIALVSILVLDDAVPWVLSLDFSKSNSLVSFSLFLGIGIAQVFLLYFSTNRMMQRQGMIKIYPELDEVKNWPSKYTADEIISWTLEAAESCATKVNKIFVLSSPLPNAFTFSLPLVGSVVVLHTNLLDVLSQDEVKAIIAHEVGHISNNDSIVSILTNMPTFFVDVIYLYIYARLALSVANALLVLFSPVIALIRVGVLLGFLLLSRVIMAIARGFVQKSSRKAELLADIHAAKIMGVEVTVNALIRLGQRTETVMVLIDEIKWLESLNPERMNPVTQAELIKMIQNYPLDGIDESNARSVAPKVFLSTRLMMMRDVYGVDLSDPQIEAAISPAVIKLQSDRTAELASVREKEGKIVDWRSVDSDGDRRLSDTEVSELIEILRNNPTKFMFEREVGMNILAMDHPDFRLRVLTLADAFEL
jgi:heat shock protein HtpX